jgi:adenylate cyclase
MPIGRTRIGLDRGAAVVGNFGGEGRIQYTALGDVMNTASRLEGANKYLHTVALASRSVAASATVDLLRPMGRITVSGRSTPLEIFEIAPHMPADDRRMLGDLYRRFDGGEIEALDALAVFVAARPDDAALANMLKRLEEAGPGGSYVLESK